MGDTRAVGATEDSARPDQSTRALQSLADFELRECLRAGELAEVYRAWDRANERWVTLARLRPEMALRPGVADLFLHTASEVSTIVHRSLIPLALGADELGVGFVLEPEQTGQSLDQVMAEAPQGLPLRDAIALMEPIAEALALAHARGVAHGGLVADRIVLAEDEDGPVPKLKGFGISDASELASVPPERMHSIAPERIAGRAPDPAADVYSLAALLYELVAGKPPPSEDAALNAVVDAPPELSRVIARCLTRKPEQRPTARALHDLLARLKRQSMIMRSATPLGLRAIRNPDVPYVPSANSVAPAEDNRDSLASLAAELGAVLDGLDTAPHAENEAASGAESGADECDIVFDTVDSVPPPAKKAAEEPAAARASARQSDDELMLDLDTGSPAGADAQTDDELEFDLSNSEPVPASEIMAASDGLARLSSLPPQLQQALRGEIPGARDSREPQPRRTTSAAPPMARVSRPAARRSGPPTSPPGMTKRSLPPRIPAAARPSRPARAARSAAPLAAHRPNVSAPPPLPSMRSSAPFVRAPHVSAPPPLPSLRSPVRGRPSAAPRVASGAPVSADSVSGFRPALSASDAVGPLAPSVAPLPAEASGAPRTKSPARLALDTRMLVPLSLWTAAFCWLAPLYYARDFSALDSLLGFGRLCGLLFVGLTAGLLTKLFRIARAEGDRVFFSLWVALSVLCACAAVLAIAALEDGPVPALLVIAARMGMSWGAMLFLIGLAIAATRRIFVARRDSWPIVSLLALLTLECLGGTAWLISRYHRIDAGESTQNAYDVDER